MNKTLSLEQDQQLLELVNKIDLGQDLQVVMKLLDRFMTLHIK
jgi:hypothetical protein